MTFSLFFKKLSIGTDHDVFCGIPSPHKILGYTSLIHVAYRYGRFLMGMPMFSNTWTDLICMNGHLLLSFSSFLFPIRTERNYKHQIIWRELQLHNIVFTSRSYAIFTYSYFFPANTHFITRFCMVMVFHIVADCVSWKYGQGTTMRDMSLDGAIIPLSYKIYLDRFYALSQFGATTFLIFSRTCTCELAFMTMFAIQISTFLMTLRLKGIINNDTWHVCYSLALLTNFPIGLYVMNGRFCAFLYTVFYMLRIHGKNLVAVPMLHNKYVDWMFILGLSLVLYPALYRGEGAAPPF